MPFGLNQAQYFFQYYMDLNFQGINPTINIIADDVMIHGSTDEEHGCHLLQVLNKCCEVGLKLSPDKCEFGQTSVKFYGNVVSDQGLKARSQESWCHCEDTCTQGQNTTCIISQNVSVP